MVVVLDVNGLGGCVNDFEGIQVLRRTSAMT